MKSCPGEMSSDDGSPRSLIPEKPCLGLGVPGVSTLWKISVYAVPTWSLRGAETGPPGEKSHARTETTTVWGPAGGDGRGLAPPPSTTTTAFEVEVAAAPTAAKMSLICAPAWGESGAVSDVV